MTLREIPSADSLTVRGTGAPTPVAVRLLQAQVMLRRMLQLASAWRRILVLLRRRGRDFEKSYHPKKEARLIMEYGFVKTTQRQLMMIHDGFLKFYCLRGKKRRSVLHGKKSEFPLEKHHTLSRWKPLPSEMGM